MSDTASKNLNSKYAWREVACEGLPKRSAKDRAADFLEIYGLYDEATAREQASRCIQCPNPSCVSGCPLCNPIPQWMQLTAEGRFLEAAALLGSVTSMAEICTRVCPSDHLCEESCILSGISEPVSIRALEQFLMDYAFAKGQVDTSTAPANGKKVAVLGSGPGGLACAEELARRGFAVTIFDTALIPGGLLVNGVPAFRLDHSLVERRINLLKQRGVVFRLGGQEVPVSELQRQFDAVFLGYDSRQARKLTIPGSDLGNVIQALPFLLQKNTPLPLDIKPIEVSGKRVVVIGAGDTATDCLRAAIRYGAREVTSVYRKDERAMPCGRQEYKAAVEEGARFVFRAAPVELLGGSRGEVTALRLRRTDLTSERVTESSPSAADGELFELPADFVVLALGFEPVPPSGGEATAGLEFDSNGCLRVDENQMTALPGIFAGGDLVRGPTTLLYAVRDARRAAEQIEAYLAKRPQQTPAGS